MCEHPATSWHPLPLPPSHFRGAFPARHLPRGSNCRWQERCGNSASAQGQSTQASSVMILPTFGYFRKQGENLIAAGKNLWDGNNEPFITQNEIARKNKHPQKSTFYQSPARPKASGVQGTGCSASWAKSYSKSCPLCRRFAPVSQISSLQHLAVSFSVSQCARVAVSHFDKDVESCCNT